MPPNKRGRILQTRGRKRGHVHVQDRNFHLKCRLEWNFWLQLAQSTLSAHAHAGGVQRGFRFSVGLGPRITKNTVCSRPGLTHRGRKGENEPAEQQRMSESKYREWILDTIDSLRSRKARPDLDRICRMVRRRHGSEPDRTCAELEKLIQEQTVLKVNYKGSISYRNAAKVQRRSRKKDDVTLPAARRSPLEEASHSDLSNGDSAVGPADQDEEDLEVCRGWCQKACLTTSHLIARPHLCHINLGRGGVVQRSAWLLSGFPKW